MPANRKSRRTVAPKPSTTPWWAIAGLIVLAVIAVVLVIAAMK